ncbi:glycosyltransferase [Rathayibacter sp. YIM 133350]|uniref:glycosyltransferase n=1 Tax=Rathayibacter sp. YIM 133350 TaxID=3131992 RepID=UPI00307EA396
MKPLAFIAFAIAAVAVSFMWWRAGGPSWFGVAIMAVLAAKLVLSWTKARETSISPAELFRLNGLKVGVAVPMFNEDPLMLRAALASIHAQSRRPASIVVVDDGSAGDEAAQEADSWLARFERHGVRATVVRFPSNRGKRQALVTALDSQPDVDLLLCVDSDTVLEEHALERVLLPFVDPATTVVTGLVLALNHDRNLLTRLIDLRYANAFLFERAAYSRLGSVLCACGSLALYRADVLHKYRTDFLEQSFLGRPAVFGDDRRLTNYGLLEGRTAFRADAVAYTAVPEKMGHYIRQQIRWNKSFFRESLWVLRNMPFAKPAFWLTFVELSTWLLFTAVLVSAFVVSPLVTGGLLVGPYVVFMALLAYARSVRYVELTELHSSRDIWVGFLLAPLYGFLHVGVLMWLRLYSLATLRSGTWGTRRSVEVRLVPVGRGAPSTQRHEAEPDS